MAERTCPGDCCEAFPVGELTPEAVQAWAKSEIAEQRFIADMVVPLGKGVDGLDLFTCRHWDRDTRLCTVYEQRPKMCRDYPYDRVCGHCGLRGPTCAEGDPTTCITHKPEDLAAMGETT